VAPKDVQDSNPSDNVDQMTDDDHCNDTRPAARSKMQTAVSEIYSK